MRYEEKELQLGRGDVILLHSDGISEAHAPDRQMFGFPRLRGLLEGSPEPLIPRVLRALDEFTGPGWEQEDDITLVSLRWTAGAEPVGAATLLDLDVPSEPGNERRAMAEVAAAVAGLGLEPARLERLKTAVAEATMNAIEHGNQNRPELPVHLRVVADAARLSVFITDLGGERPIPITESPTSTPSWPGCRRRVAGDSS
jgi:hypothetical protein